jgi:chloramphenicol-sensitive protein RarD
MTDPAPHPDRAAIGMVLIAHLIWGLLPLYLMLVRSVPAFEFVGWRAIFTLPFCALFIILRRQGPELLAVLRQWRVLRLLLLSASLIACNWLVYVAAIQAGQVYAASFGYYLTPLVQVAAGTVFLGERLSRRQWSAVTLSGLGVVLLGLGALDMLWLSLAMALSWSAYGLVRKLTPVGSLPGLTVETLVLLPGALALAGWYAASPAGSSFGGDPGLSAAIALSGVITAVPLTLFAIAARRLDFSTLGMLQFASPTLVFVLGVTVFDLPLGRLQLASFALIWAAIAVFLWDLTQRRSAGQAPA